MKAAFAALAAALTLGAAAARAEDLALDPLPEDYRSPQHFAFELKFGTYSPNIDATGGLTGKPFSDEFVAQDSANAGKRPDGKLLTSMEFDWQFWHGFGSLGVGVSAGLMRVSTHSFVYGTATDGSLVSCPVVPGQLNCQRSGDTNTLSVIPLTLELVYRFDVLSKRWNIPVVPYLKGGIGYYLWWVADGSGNLAHNVDKTSQQIVNTGTCGFGGDCALGGTFGLVAHPGIALMLDFLDPGSARTMDNELGINHTYLFCELNYAWINGFGSATKLNLSDTGWNAGLAFEF